ncbi:MAG TPA: hypothetical protein PLF32_02680 [Bacteroidales bacterium]|jgi:hypothetical protein|nr:hypothetical protein [Bacteroidales bacterium]HOF15498.1 hypothetical protein [Bacteroidales bacterium]HOR81544.1 hypothetical protein [Bacteroidales bacterium]HPJ90378.1 hypothetical protein [Bacteroidales bacterium]HPX59666.1 hypothetical protein [Bacteroidales bacterium]
MKIVNKFIVLILLFVFTSNSQAQTSHERKDWGPTFITSASFVNGIHKVTSHGGINNIANKIPTVGISQFMGYQFSHYFMVGLGVSFDYWTKPRNAFIPIYLDLRINMMNHDFSPHWYVNVGYGSRWNIDSKAQSAHGINTEKYVLHGAKPGIMLESGLGVKANASYSNAIILTFTMKAQESAVKYWDSSTGSGGTQEKYFPNTYENNWYLFIGVKAGITF